MVLHAIPVTVGMAIIGVGVFACAHCMCIDCLHCDRVAKRSCTCFFWVVTIVFIVNVFYASFEWLVNGRHIFFEGTAQL